MNRRAVLSGLVAGVAGLAGCSQLESEDDDGEIGTISPTNGTAADVGNGDASDDSETDQPAAVLRQHLEALARGNQAAADALVHEAGNRDTVSDEAFSVESVERVTLADVLENADGVPDEDVEAEVRETDEAIEDTLAGTGVDDYAVVAHQTVFDGERQQLLALVVEDDGEWLVYDTSVGLVPSSAATTEPGTTSTNAAPLNTISTVGSLSDAASAVEVLRVVVAKAPGTGDIDLAALTVRYSGPDADATLTYRGDGGDGGFALSPIAGNEDAPTNVLAQLDQRYALEVPLGDRQVNGVDNDGVLEPLSEGDQAVLSLQPADGTAVVVQAAVPERLPDDTSAVEL